jgi:hypothetical protein
LRDFEVEMKNENPARGRNRSWRPLALTATAALAAFCLAAILRPGADLARGVSAQTDFVLERRISQIEQRFYMLESRMSRVEHAAVPSAAPTGNLSRIDSEITGLRSQIDLMLVRLGELECAAAKLDERTLTAAARASRAQTRPGPVDVCRKGPGEPIRLSARP